VTSQLPLKSIDQRQVDENGLRQTSGRGR
jgi:hypothetical protein